MSVESIGTIVHNPARIDTPETRTHAEVTAIANAQNLMSAPTFGSTDPDVPAILHPQGNAQNGAASGDYKYDFSDYSFPIHCAGHGLEHEGFQQCSLEVRNAWFNGLKPYHGGASDTGARLKGRMLNLKNLLSLKLYQTTSSNMRGMVIRGHINTSGYKNVILSRIEIEGYDNRGIDGNWYDANGNAVLQDYADDEKTQGLYVLRCHDIEGFIRWCRLSAYDEATGRARGVSFDTANISVSGKSTSNRFTVSDILTAGSLNYYGDQEFTWPDQNSTLGYRHTGTGFMMNDYAHGYTLPKHIEYSRIYSAGHSNLAFGIAEYGEDVHLSDLYLASWGINDAGRNTIYNSGGLGYVDSVYPGDINDLTLSNLHVLGINTRFLQGARNDVAISALEGSEETTMKAYLEAGRASTYSIPGFSRWNGFQDQSYNHSYDWNSFNSGWDYRDVAAAIHGDIRQAWANSRATAGVQVGSSAANSYYASSSLSASDIVVVPHLGGVSLSQAHMLSTGELVARPSFGSASLGTAQRKAVRFDIEVNGKLVSGATLGIPVSELAQLGGNVSSGANLNNLDGATVRIGGTEINIKIRL